MLLVGFMAAGKTTVGALLAERLGWTFVDLDGEIERAAGSSVTDLFASEGEPGFRRREAAATVALRGRERIVVATGGGWVANSEVTREDRAGTVVWLQVTPAEAVRRAAVAPGRRPLLGASADGAAELLAARVARYAAADLIIDTDGREPHEIAAEIIEALDMHTRQTG